MKQSKNIDKDEFQKTFETIQKESLEYNENIVFSNAILKGENPFLTADPKYTTEKKVLETVDNLLLSQAEKNQADEQTKFAYVDGAYTPTGIFLHIIKNYLNLVTILDQQQHLIQLLICHKY